MCLDKEWQGWADAWMSKKDPQVKASASPTCSRRPGREQHGSVRDGEDGDNNWVVSPPHIMVLTPDSKQLDALPTDWHTADRG